MGSPRLTPAASGGRGRAHVTPNRQTAAQSKQGHIRSVQFSCSVVSDSLQPHGPQHARLPCPSPTPGVYSKTASHSSILAWRIPMDRGAWRARVHKVQELDTTERVNLSMYPAYPPAWVKAGARLGEAQRVLTYHPCFPDGRKRAPRDSQVGRDVPRS